MVTSFVISGLPQLPRLLLALAGLVLAVSGRFRTSRAGLATLGWMLAVANVVFALLGLLVIYLVIYRSNGDYGLLALNSVANLVVVVLALGTWACFLVALLAQPVAGPPSSGNPYPYGSPGTTDPRDPGRSSPPAP